jgi:hypothetical protein
MINRIDSNDPFYASEDERLEEGAFDALHNVLGFSLCNGPFWHDDSPHCDRPIRDNFSSDGPAAAPLEEEETLTKFGVRLWATVDQQGDVLAEAAAGLRRMAQFLNDKADGVDAKRRARADR